MANTIICTHLESAQCFTQGHKMRPVILEQNYIFNEVPPQEQALPKSILTQAIAINQLHALQDVE